jgi:hypothetical protein
VHQGEESSGPMGVLGTLVVFAFFVLQGEGVWRGQGTPGPLRKGL